MTTSQASAEFLSPTETIDSGHPAVAAFASDHAASGGCDIERAVSLYYAVRDGIRYDAYQLDLTLPGMKASRTLETKHGWCVSKAILLAASCRSLGIPARLGFADVRNHLSTERLRQRMQTDVFYWHGYTDIFLEDKWIKATPAFNIELCQKFGLLPLEFDGREDSLYHPFDAEGKRHMEYLAYRGAYADLPLDEIIETFRLKYHTLDREWDPSPSSFDEDVTRETRGRVS